MTELPTVAHLLQIAPPNEHTHVVLDYDARLIRRKLLRASDDSEFLVDLHQVTNLDAYWGFELSDGRHVRIAPASERVLVITGNIPRLAWHIGNRHTPCQIFADRLIIREDHVLEAMLLQLGAVIEHAVLPFTPEGGAYGHGRTMGHSHGPDPVHDHSHSHSHGHTHSHHEHGDHGHSHNQQDAASTDIAPRPTAPASVK